MSINMVQAFEFETDDLEDFGKILQVILPVMFHHKYDENGGGQYTQLHLQHKPELSFDNGRQYSGSKDDQQPRYMWVATCGDYIGEGLKEQDIKVRTFAEMHEKVMAEMKAVAKHGKEKFTKLCGDGYNSWFNSFDGSISMGYRMNYRPRGGWNLLDVSVCHVYYGK